MQMVWSLLQKGKPLILRWNPPTWKTKVSAFLPPSLGPTHTSPPLHRMESQLDHHQMVETT